MHLKPGRRRFQVATHASIHRPRGVAIWKPADLPVSFAALPPPHLLAPPEMKKPRAKKAVQTKMLLHCQGTEGTTADRAEVASKDHLVTQGPGLRHLPRILKDWHYLFLFGSAPNNAQNRTTAKS